MVWFVLLLDLTLRCCLFAGCLLVDFGLWVVGCLLFFVCILFWRFVLVVSVAWVDLVVLMFVGLVWCFTWCFELLVCDCFIYWLFSWFVYRTSVFWLLCCWFGFSWCMWVFDFDFVFSCLLGALCWISCFWLGVWVVC